jgi:peptidoglycan/LPS O-acetylase OafA/YrhL
VLYVVVMAISLAVSAFTFRFVEQPFLRLRSRRSVEPVLAPPPAVPQDRTAAGAG